LDSLDLDTLKEKGGAKDLDDEDAKAVIQAVLNEGGRNEDWSDAAKAFYDYLTLNAAEAPEYVKPEITTAAVTLKTNREDHTDTEPSYTADVTFTVQMTPSVTGDLLVNIQTAEGSQSRRVRLDPVGSAESNGCIVKQNEDGTYTITIYDVKLSADSDPVDLEIIAAGEALIQRTITEVTTEVLAATSGQNQTLTNDNRVDIWSGNLAPNPNDGTYTYEGVEYTVNFSYEVKEDGSVEEQGENPDNISIHYDHNGTSATITGPEDKDIYVKFIAIKAGTQCVIYEVEGGILHAGQVITVDSVLKDDGSALREISHVALIGVTGARTDIVTAYGLNEISLTKEAKATLSLNFTGGTIAKNTAEEGQIRSGTAAVTQSAITTREQIITELNWSSVRFERDNTPAPPPPGGGDDDPAPPPPGGGGGTTTTTPGDDDDDDIAIIPRTPTPLARTPAAAPAADIADEAVPLAEIPETETPLAEAPGEELEDIFDEDVPLADVPKTGDGSAVWYAAALMSLCGLAALTPKKREGEEA